MSRAESKPNATRTNASLVAVGCALTVIAMATPSAPMKYLLFMSACGLCAFAVFRSMKR